MKWTTTKVADLFMVSSQTVINWSDKGKLKFNRLDDGPRRYSSNDLIEFIRDNGISDDHLNQSLLAQLKGKNPNICTMSFDKNEIYAMYLSMENRIKEQPQHCTNEFMAAFDKIRIKARIMIGEGIE